ncbi:protein TolQ [Terasakiispira papahanaumokuakeensis]|uniref:Tol-Pal system protein TolQ n=1 Tax=Terasakiispira papahanaumokuakeensis TaxID=197479 RepID=A0A1E2V8W5_9GAMM|nr:protein TolQ [Terasakiispira papahanaumokuakeensis]ODC03431.1 protein TolQ [Terasakiispira papahanaumokuakeensis]
MSEPLSFWSLVANASVLVQLVMLALLVASVISWVTLFQRWMLMTKARKTLAAFRKKFWSGIDLAELFRDTQSEQTEGAERVIFSGYKTFNKVRQLSQQPAPLMECVERSMRVALAEEEERLQFGLPLLATIGSTSPYVGLFGTVWGIMESFRGLANVQQATLAVVAPGIAEALIATAMGLFAAIPAFIAYNRFVAASEGLAGQYENFAEEFAGILQRNLLNRQQEQA